MGLRILATGDFQLGKMFRGYGENAVTLQNQLFETARDIIEVRASDYDICLIAGDIFDRIATPTNLIEGFADVLSRCKAKVLLIPGNHDPVNSGIPKALSKALEFRSANHVYISLEKEPVRFDDLDVTVYPAPLMRKDDLSDLWGWIPERSDLDGTRVGLFHAALTSLPNGVLPTDLAERSDLDLVVVGDQHGPGKMGEDASDIFNLDVSRSRRLYYAAAPEAQNINQSWIGSFLSLEVSVEGAIESAERIEIGKMSFVNEQIGISESDPVKEIKDRLEHVMGRDPQLTVIRLSLTGEISLDSNLEVESYIEELSTRFPMLEVVNGYEIAQQDEAPSVVLSDPAIDRIFNEIDTASDRDPVKRRARELLVLNVTRWTV